VRAIFCKPRCKSGDAARGPTSERIIRQSQEQVAYRRSQAIETFAKTLGVLLSCDATGQYLLVARDVAFGHHRGRTTSSINVEAVE
jgi:hypothetical protein